MRVSTYSCFVALAVIVTGGYADAECHKRTSDAPVFGIDDGELCSFGGEDGPVLPVEAAPVHEESQTDSLFTYQERRNMLRGIVSRNRSGGNEGLLKQSVDGAFRPLGGPVSHTPIIITR